jgi:serine/threonine-protein kinase
MTHSRQNDPEPLEELGQRFELLHQLREEPWGDVWLAEDRLLNTEVALKIYPRSAPDWPAGQKILAREATLAFSLRHPLILGVSFLGEAEDGVYLIEEPFPGESLIALLSRKQRFPLPQTLGLLEQVGQALAFAHQRGTAHQALSPLNVLIMGEEARVANFAYPSGDGGQAAHLELKAYTPPEVLHGEEVSPAGNVFSLGVLGYRLLAGSLPYPLTFDEPFPYRLETLPVDLEEIPLPLQNLLLQCLAPEPEHRLADAGEFLKHLRQLRETWQGSGREVWLPEETPAGAPSWRRPPGTGFLKKIANRGKQGAQALFSHLCTAAPKLLPASRRWRWGLGLGGIVLILVAVGVAGKFRAPSPPEPTAPATAIPPPGPGTAARPGDKEEPPAPAEPAPPPKPALPLKTGPGQTRAVTSPPSQVEKPASKEDKYVVIAGTFSQQDQAKALAKKLRGKNYQPQVVKTAVKGKASYQVRLGPYPGKKVAEDTAKRLKSKENLKPALAKLKTKPMPGGPR